MQELNPRHWWELERGLPCEKVGALTAQHGLGTGLGRWWVDRWPRPRAALQFCGGMMDLWGDANRVSAEDYGRVVDELLFHWDRLFVQPRHGFDGLLEARPGGLRAWSRLEYLLHQPPVMMQAPAGMAIRAICPDDLVLLEALSDEIRWIADRWQGMENLSRSGWAVGAFEGERLLSVAAVSALGREIGEMAVVTEPDARGRGASPACSGVLARIIIASGRRAGWSTSIDNLASQAVASKLGFVLVDRDELWWEGAPPPAPSQRDSGG